ncbi:MULTISPECIES: FkbM family methyltransferase [Sphingomonas]|uniref:FkbM family methyltransferase n=1 Tax=Sphingomonas kyeonggiensis TaxID=1268553 RepID=A0A7W7NTI3_9SPHN|nr:FkbM family methyltransferase [Sphingomonas kyeonggiensis]MBB4839779.1 FkbM family methyltransferase [Sphingomonas kyeonggiensis]
MITFRRVARGLKNLYRREVLRDGPLLEAKRWFRDKGDTTLRLDYPLDEDSIVVDLGGYIGQWALDIHERYGSTVHVFEPVPSLHATCVERFSGKPKLHAHRYGLSDKDGTFAITDDGDASSFVSLEKSDSHINCELRSAPAALDALGLDHIDLLKLNIEGGEFAVLPALIEAGWLPRIRFLQIQFHTVGDYDAMRDAIRAKLAETHDEQWCYRFVWEGWERKPG